MINFKKIPCLKVSDFNKLIAPVSEENKIKHYVHNKQIYNIVHEVRLSIGPDGHPRKG
jgi:ribonuclease HIII